MVGSHEHKWRLACPWRRSSSCPVAPQNPHAHGALPTSRGGFGQLVPGRYSRSPHFRPGAEDRDWRRPGGDGLPVQHDKWPDPVRNPNHLQRNHVFCGFSDGAFQDDGDCRVFGKHRSLHGKFRLQRHLSQISLLIFGSSEATAYKTIFCLHNA